MSVSSEEISAELGAVADQLDRLAEAAEKLAAAAQEIVGILRGSSMPSPEPPRGVHGEVEGESLRGDGTKVMTAADVNRRGEGMGGHTRTVPIDPALAESDFEEGR